MDLRERNKLVMRSGSFAAAGVCFCAELPATFGAPALDECSPTGGAHTLAEAMRSSQRFS